MLPTPRAPSRSDELATLPEFDPNFIDEAGLATMVHSNTPVVSVDWQSDSDKRGCRACSQASVSRRNWSPRASRVLPGSFRSLARNRPQKLEAGHPRMIKAGRDAPTRLDRRPAAKREDRLFIDAVLYRAKDTGYDSDAIRNCVRQQGMKAVIHPNPTRRRKPRLDRKTYSKRYLVEVFFHHLKRFRCLATRFEKTAKHYLALLHVACTMTWL